MMYNSIVIVLLTAISWYIEVMQEAQQQVIIVLMQLFI